MAIELIGKIKPKNNGTLAMADAVDIEMPDGSRLTAHLEAKDAAIDQQLSALGEQDTALSGQIDTQGQKISALEAELATKETALAQQIASLSQTDQTLAQADAALAKRTKAVEDTLADFSVSYPIETSGTALQPETYYAFGEVDSLSVTLVDPNDGKVHEYCFEFKPSASFKEESLSITPKPNWANQLQFAEGKTCQVSIMRGIGVMVCA
jgi:hypothetical protein